MTNELTDIEKKIIARYKDGDTWKKIRETLGVTDNQIRYALKHGNVKLRMPHLKRPGSVKASRFNQATDKSVLNAVMASNRIAQAIHDVSKDMARAFGVPQPSLSAVYQFLKEVRTKN